MQNLSSSIEIYVKRMKERTILDEKLQGWVISPLVRIMQTLKQRGRMIVKDAWISCTTSVFRVLVPGAASDSPSLAVE